METDEKPQIIEEKEELVAEMIEFKKKYDSLTIENVLKIYEIKSYNEIARQLRRLANG